MYYVYALIKDKTYENSTLRRDYNLRENCTRSRTRIHTEVARLGGDYTRCRMRISAKQNLCWMLKQSGLFVEGIIGEEGHNWRRLHMEGTAREGEDLIVLLEIC